MKTAIIIPTELESRYIGHKGFILSGIGKVYATIKVMELIHKGYKRIVLIGTCASLDNTPIFTVVYTNRFYEWDMNCTGLGFKRGVTPFSDLDNPITETKFTGEILNLEYYINEPLMSGDTFINEGLALPYRFVDMEAAAIAKVCNKFDIEFIAIKVVTDNADKDSKQNWEKNCQKAGEILTRVKIL